MTDPLPAPAGSTEDGPAAAASRGAAAATAGAAGASGTGALLIEGRQAFTDAVRQAVAAAVAAGEPEVVWVDPDFAAWPLNDADLVDRLTRWAHPAARLQLLARHFDEVPRRHPRFVAWRRTWAHRVTCRAAPDVDASEMPTLLLAGPFALQIVDRLHLRGRWLPNAAERQALREAVDAISQRSQDAFGATTLGL